MPVTLEWRLADVNGQPGPINTVLGPDGAGAITLLPSASDVQVRTAGSSTWTNLRTLAAPVDPDAIPIIRQSAGGRPNRIPRAFYKARWDEIRDPLTHVMPTGTFNIHAGGFASDVSKWSLGRLPQTGDSISIASGMGIIWDLESDAILNDISVPFNCVWTLATWKDTKIRFRYWISMGIVNKTDPTPSTTQGKIKHQFIIHPDNPGQTTRGGVMYMGPTRVRGAKKESWLKLAVTSGETEPGVRAGSETIVVQGLAAANWRVGQTIIIGGTNHLPLAATDPQYTGPTRYFIPNSQGGSRHVNLNEFQFGEEEERVITGISGNIISFSGPLLYDHIGFTRTLDDGLVITISPVVGNPSHSIEYRSASFEEDGHLDATADITDLQKRAHLMFHGCDDVDDRWNSHKNMGRTDTNPTLTPGPGNRSADILTVSSSNSTPIADPNNVRGRYSRHYHGLGYFMSSPMTVCEGTSDWAPLDAVPVPGWGNVQHMSRMIIHNAMVFNIRGGGIISELGNEIGQWTKCLAMFVRGDGETHQWDSRAERYVNHNDSYGVGFGNQSRAILMHDNVAVSCKYAYTWNFQKINYQSRGYRPIDLRFKDGVNKVSTPVASFAKDEVLGANTVQIPPFLFNTAIACYLGLQVTHRISNWYLINGYDNTPMVVEQFNCLNVEIPLEIPNYSNHYWFKDCLWKRQTYGGSAARLGDVTWSWNFSNMHLVNYATQFINAGAGLNYHGFFVGITWEGGGSFSNSFSGGANQSHSSWGVMGSSDANYSRIWQNTPRSQIASLRPYPAAPYGYGGQLPAGESWINPGDKPKFILGNGVDNTGINLNLVGGQGRDRTSFHGIIIDSLGMMRWPDWQSSETYPSNISVKGPRNLYKTQPEQLIQMWGCWNDGTEAAPDWKTRVWWFTIDRMTHVPLWFYIDFNITTGFSAEFLQAHTNPGNVPAPEPEDPFKVEQIPLPRPLTPVTKALRILSRKQIEAVSGQPLAHVITPNVVSARISIVPGLDSAEFSLMMGTLSFSGTGTRTSGVYSVNIRVQDHWGNFTEELHIVTMLPATAVTEFSDNFNRANGLLNTDPRWTVLSGSPNAWTVASNRVSFVGTTGINVIASTPLASSDFELFVNFTNQGHPLILARVVDENNFLAFVRRDSNNAVRAYMVVDGVWTHLCDFTNFSTNTWKFTFDGNKLIATHEGSSTLEPIVRYPISGTWNGIRPLELDSLTEAGGLLLPDNSPKGTRLGFFGNSSSSLSGFVDNVIARVITPA